MLSNKSRFPKSKLPDPTLKSYNFLVKFTSSTSIAVYGPVNPVPSPCTLNEPVDSKLPVTVAAPVIVTPDCQLSTSVALVFFNCLFCQSIEFLLPVSIVVRFSQSTLFFALVSRSMPLPQLTVYEPGPLPIFNKRESHAIDCEATASYADRRSQ